jgi:uncharacterized membrane protein YdjX (TVP38/TMEM64 family)
MDATRTTVITIVLLVAFGAALIWAHQAGVLDLSLIQELVDEAGAWGLLVYGVAYVVLGMLGLSKIAMTVLAGAIFPLAEAWIVTVIAATVAATLGFYLTRHFKAVLSRRIMKSQVDQQKSKLQSIIERIEKNAGERGFYTVAILRLSFVPLMFLSYASGLVTTLRSKEFISAILVTNAYVNFVYIFLGDSLTRNIAMFSVAIAVLLLSMWVPKIIERVGGGTGQR